MKPPQRKGHSDLSRPADERTHQESTRIPAQATEDRTQRLTPIPGRRSAAAEFLQQISRERWILGGLLQNDSAASLRAEAVFGGSYDSSSQLR